ncbi:MAG: chorismate synthase, partial [Parachlamydiales bacterium]
MPGNSFGKLFCLSTFGESHGKAIGVLIDGCPPGLKITQKDLEAELRRRATGKIPFTSQRQEKDQVEILSGLQQNLTTGAPLALIIRNRDFSSDYRPLQNLYRPGHADYTYRKKYGLPSLAGGGRASARETAARVAGGAIAKKFLKTCGIELLAFVCQIGPWKIAPPNLKNFSGLQKKCSRSRLFCPDPKAEKAFLKQLSSIQKEQQTIGGAVQLISTPLPIGLGEPVFEKLPAKLAGAMFSLPAVKAFEIGRGVASALLKGSEMNDLLTLEKGQLKFKTNRSGGMLGGISNGSFLDLKVTFKPISSIGRKQFSYSLEKEKKALVLPDPAKHDLCAALRAPVIVEAMAALVLADLLLLKRA